MMTDKGEECGDDGEDGGGSGIGDGDGNGDSDGNAGNLRVAVCADNQFQYVSPTRPSTLHQPGPPSMLRQPGQVRSASQAQYAPPTKSGLRPNIRLVWVCKAAICLDLSSIKRVCVVI